MLCVLSSVSELILELYLGSADFAGKLQQRALLEKFCN